jgi:hypothetical protein
MSLLIHLLPCLFKELLLFTSLFFIATKLFLFKLVFPFFTLFTTTVKTGKIAQLLGVRDRKHVSFSFAAKSYLRRVQAF